VCVSGSILDNAVSRSVSRRMVFNSLLFSGNGKENEGDGGAVLLTAAATAAAATAATTVGC